MLSFIITHAQRSLINGKILGGTPHYYPLTLTALTKKRIKGASAEKVWLIESFEWDSNQNKKNLDEINLNTAISSDEGQIKTE